MSTAARACVRREATAADRKVVLARMMATAEAERLGISPTDDDVHRVAAWWRSEYGLEDLQRFARWLRFSGLDVHAFMGLMRQFAALSAIEGHYAEEIDARIDEHLAIHTIHAFRKLDAP